MPAKEKPMHYQALAFDTGGTVLDWHGSIVDELIEVAAWRGADFDRHEFANTWRRRTMKGIVGQVHPSFNMDDVHLTALDETVRELGLPQIREADRQHLWRVWHRLRAWPDFAPALAALRERLPVVSFTMLPTSLVVDVSRRNGITWDAIVSCEMIGVYKPNPEAYSTAARWLNLEPARILMVACHNFDLGAAHAAGMRTAFVRRPDEWGPAGPPDPHPSMAYDHVVDGFDALREQVLASGAPHTQHD
jgi:2-haloacid dehalogenase